MGMETNGNAIYGLHFDICWSRYSSDEMLEPINEYLETTSLGTYYSYNSRYDNITNLIIGVCIDECSREDALELMEKCETQLLAEIMSGKLFEIIGRDPENNKPMVYVTTDVYE